MGKRPTIEFSVDPELKREAMIYAKVRGFEKDSTLARIALVAYMRKNPIKEALGEHKQ
jgi:hypothetical protein